MAISVRASTLLVTNTNDSDPGSLRQALADAIDGDTISFDPALNGQTINLTSAELAVDKNITINGPGPNSLAVSGGNFRAFHVMPQHSVTIEGLTVRDGRGGIYNDHAALTVSNCVVRRNWGGYGGGAYNDGTLTIINSTITENCACDTGVAYGGGVYNDGTLTIINSTVSNNSAPLISSQGEGHGGGIYSGGTLTVIGSTIIFNYASESGGGISGGGTLTNSTISGNMAGGGDDGIPGWGGGIFGGVTISNSTISGNTAWGDDFKGPGLGGGIFSVGAVTTNSIFSYNSATEGDNSYGAVTSHGYNVCGGCGLNGPGGSE